MNALSTRHEDHRTDPGVPSGAAAAAAGDYVLGLQLCRAGMLSLTRLQLALERGDRPRAMEAIDDLHALDSAVERLVDALPASDDPRHAEVRQSLQREKMAVAFEKLALASGISGPGLASQPAFPRSAAARDNDEQQLVADWPPAEARTARLVRRHGPKAVLLFAIIAATLAIMFMAL